MNFRAKVFKVMDGDLGLFIKKDTFHNLGGFDFVPIMEDILFSRKIRKAGKVSILPQTISVSARKWQKQGFIKTFLQYTKAYILLWTNFYFWRGLKRG